MSAIEDFGVLLALICERWSRADTPDAWLELAAILNGAMLALPFAASDDAFVLAMIAIERG